MIARIEFHYSSAERLKEVVANPEEFAKLKLALGKDVPQTNPEDMYRYGDNLLIDLATDGHILADLGLLFVVKRMKGLLAIPGLPSLSTPNTQNVYIQVPGIGLITIDDTKLLEDCCTDRLQAELDDGWRILCVCPPNAQRRPDYIMGRQKGNNR